MDILYYINHVLQKSLNLFNIVNYQTFLKSRSQGQFTRKLGNSIFYFRCVALDADTGEDAIRRLAILVEKRHTLPPTAQVVVNRLVKKIDGLFLTDYRCLEEFFNWCWKHFQDNNDL